LLATGELVYRFLSEAQAFAQSTHAKKRRRPAARHAATSSTGEAKP
jgi:hypothetical protein